MRTLLLDTGPLGQLVHGNKATRNKAKVWLTSLLLGGAPVRIPGIADYELRRVLFRRNFADSISRLDNLIATLGYLDMSRSVSKQAAIFWANARNTGQQTAPDTAIDGDMWLCAHACLEASGNCLVATG